MNRYRVLLPLLVHTETNSYGQGEEFDHEFSEDDETTNVKSGLLEIVPRRYRVISTNIVHNTLPGDTFEAALPKGQEALLLESGNIERDDDEEDLSKLLKSDLVERAVAAGIDTDGLNKAELVDALAKSTPETKE